jgi:DNA (cytosine-5)-methyltransferase 1
MTSAIYNEIDPFASKWLKNLIAGGRIAQGKVDNRSVTEITPGDVAGSGQRHFFAGIGGWSYALRLAGVPDDADVWTGSCPCQPFSDAGKRVGVFDARHLWPAWFELIRECRPATIFGEQVASRDGLGWLDLVRSDLERCGYAFGASDLCAAGVGAPHRRQRLYFVAYADRKSGRLLAAQRQPRRTDAQAERSGEARELAYADVARSQGRSVSGNGNGSGERTTRPHCVDGRVADATGERRAESQSPPPARAVEPDVARRVYVDHHGAVRGFWGDADWLLCRDPYGGPPVARPVEPGSFPMASRVPGSVGLIRGYGNAIVPQVAATFIRAALEAA